MRRLGRPVAEAAAAAALGALLTPACVHTAWWPLPFACIALLVALLRQATPRRAALIGWAFSTGWLCAGVWWLFISMHRYGGLPAWTAAGYPVTATSDSPPDKACIDYLFFVHDRHDGNKAAARQYLAWETNLVSQLDALEVASFRLPNTHQESHP